MLVMSAVVGRGLAQRFHRVPRLIRPIDSSIEASNSSNAGKLRAGTCVAVTAAAAKLAETVSGPATWVSVQVFPVLPLQSPLQHGIARLKRDQQGGVLKQAGAGWRVRCVLRCMRRGRAMFIEARRLRNWH